MQPTRRQIVEILKQRGRATVDELSKEIGITLMAVRLHLVVLERDGLVIRGSVREGPGRPTLVYRLTEQAEEVFPKHYDQLANNLLAAAKTELGAEGVEALLLRAAQQQAAELREQLGAGGLSARSRPWRALRPPRTSCAAGRRRREATSSTATRAPTTAWPGSTPKSAPFTGGP